MSAIDIIQLILIIANLSGGIILFFYNLWRLPKSFKFMGFYNIALVALFLSMVWPLITLYYLWIWQSERERLK